jgi:Fe2+ or Zn2+ uptake regulation protein
MDFAEKELRQLDRKARSSGFHLFRDQLELHGLCDSCQSAAG